MGFGVLFTQGLATGQPRVTLQEILEQAEAADRLGFGAALTTEHKYSDEYFGSPIPLSFAIAARTQRGPVQLPRPHPPLRRRGGHPAAGPARRRPPAPGRLDAGRAAPGRPPR